MEDLKIITPVTIPTEWVSSITYPRKPDGTLCICLDPRDLNRATIREHYKAPTLEEISHKLAGATVFSKLDTKDRFWECTSRQCIFSSHHLHYPQRQIQISKNALWSKDGTRCFPDENGSDYRKTTRNHCHT